LPPHGAPLDFGDTMNAAIEPVLDADEGARFEWRRVWCVGVGHTC
jgi:hypothetical protein